MFWAAGHRNVTARQDTTVMNFALNRAEIGIETMHLADLLNVYHTYASTSLAQLYNLLHERAVNELSGFNFAAIFAFIAAGFSIVTRCSVNWGCWPRITGAPRAWNASNPGWC